MRAEVWGLITVLALGFAVLGWTRPVAAFYALAILAPWQDLMVDVGLRLTLFTLASVGVLVAAGRMLFSRWRFIWLDKVWLPLVLLLVWAVSWGAIQAFHLPAAQVAGGALRNPLLRPFVQMASFFLILFPAIAAPLVLDRMDQVFTMLKAYLLSVLVLVLIGWWQLWTANLTGQYPLPMGAVNTWLGGMGATARMPVDLGPNRQLIYRMTSLAGEPRYLAQAIATGLLLVQIAWMSRKQRLSLLSLAVFGFLAAAMIATQAMSGLYLWIIGALTLLIVGVWQKRKVSDHAGTRNFKRIGVIATCLLCGLLVLAYCWIHPGNGLIGFVSSWMERIVRRGLIADFDAVVLDFLRAKPAYIWLGVGLGNVHLYADAYLNDYFRVFAGGSSFVADSGWLRLISELGLVGLGLFLWWSMALLKELKSLNDSAWQHPYRKIFIPLLAVAVTGYLARGTSYAPNAFILFASVTAAIFIARRPE